jgi:predicted unusual protein kinase regulating ubiquinone biosynthesis (AarF/ABC1/UbiB family)
MRYGPVPGKLPEAHPEAFPEIFPDLTAPAARIDFRRYRKLRRFVARTFVHVLWWDVFLNAPGLRRLRRPALGRWLRIARRYRMLATEMGGVLIKVGQFLSVRADLLPPEITRELSGLQDEVPPEPFEAVERRIEEDFGRPVSDVFSWVSPTAVGSASLAQVHLARLPTGEEVVVKVLRPSIEVLVETDLAAVGLAIRLAKVSRRLRRRVDFDRLAVEIVSTTRRELDMKLEAANAERFAELFANDDRVYIPAVHRAQSSRHTLTLENVGWIKIADLPRMEAAGIRREEVARALYRVYMEQIFVHHFVHSDPHPGNLFVRPLPAAGELPFPPGAPVPPPPPEHEGPRRFQVVFVDFGMVALIPEHLQGALREYVIGLGTRDASRVVHSYLAAGVLLPGADLRRLEEVHEALFERFWGVRIGDLRDVAFSEAGWFLREYRDLLYEIPFQMQVDLLFASRAVGLLAGLSTQLDPAFDPWAETIPFARRLAREELSGHWRELLHEGLVEAQALLRMPRRVETFLSRAERGSLVVQTSLAPETKKMIQRLERSMHRLAWMVISAGLLISGAMLHVNAPEQPYGVTLAVLSALVFLYGTLSKR